MPYDATKKPSIDSQEQIATKINEISESLEGMRLEDALSVMVTLISRTISQVDGNEKKNIIRALADFINSQAEALLKETAGNMH